MEVTQANQSVPFLYVVIIFLSFELVSANNEPDYYKKLGEDTRILLRDMASLYATLLHAVRRNGRNVTAEELTLTSSGRDELRLLADLHSYFRLRAESPSNIICMSLIPNSRGSYLCVLNPESVSATEAINDYSRSFEYLATNIYAKILEDSVVCGAILNIPEYEYSNGRLIIYFPRGYLNELPNELTYFNVEYVPFMEFRWMENERAIAAPRNYEGVPSLNRNRWKINQTSKEKRYKTLWLKNDAIKCVNGTAEQFASDPNFFATGHIIPLELIDKFLNFAVPLVDYKLDEWPCENDVARALIRLRRRCEERVIAGGDLKRYGETDFLNSRLRAIRGDWHPDYVSRAELNWIPGNLLYIPRDRLDDPGNDFEYTCQDLIGDVAFNNLLTVFNNMLEIINKIEKMKQDDDRLATDFQLLIETLANDRTFYTFVDRTFGKYVNAGGSRQKPRLWNETEWQHLNADEALKKGYYKTIKSKKGTVQTVSKPGWIRKPKVTTQKADTCPVKQNASLILDPEQPSCSYDWRSMVSTSSSKSKENSPHRNLYVDANSDEDDDDEDPTPISTSTSTSSITTTTSPSSNSTSLRNCDVKKKKIDECTKGSRCESDKQILRSYLNKMCVEQNICTDDDYDYDEKTLVTMILALMLTKKKD